MKLKPNEAGGHHERRPPRDCSIWGWVDERARPTRSAPPLRVLDLDTKTRAARANLLHWPVVEELDIVAE